VAADDPLPLVLAGTSRALAYFDEITTHARWIIGRVDGNHEATSAEELANLVGPLVEAHDASRRAEVIAELDEAVGSGRVVVGVEAVGEATLAGRTRVLLAEEDFSYPARIVDRRLEPAGDPDAPGVIDDVVDELLEQALDLSGDVVIVGSGELGDHGPIAALLRY
jgi:peptide subunit release factor 1 (eRF1)